MAMKNERGRHTFSRTYSVDHELKDQEERALEKCRCEWTAQRQEVRYSAPAEVNLGREKHLVGNKEKNNSTPSSAKSRRRRNQG